MGPDESVLFGCFGLLLLVVGGILVAALVTARKARAEVEQVRRDVDRLERILQVVVDRTARIERGMGGRPPEAEPRKEEVPPPPRPIPHLVPRESRLRAMADEAAAPTAPTEPGAAPEPAPYPVTITPDRAPPEALSFESFLGGRVFLVAGILFAVLGLAWIFKVAVDRNWIGPGVRVAMGAAAGVAALLGGDRLRAKGWTVYGHGIMGGGLAALYVTAYFASVRYGLVGRPAASAAMAILTAAGAGLAVWREAPLLAYLGFLGGFLAPGLLSTGEDRLAALLGWLSLVDAGVFAATLWRRWFGLDLMATIFGAIYFVAWEKSFNAPGREAEAGDALALLVALGLATALGPPVSRREAPAPTALFAAFLAGLLGTLGGSEFLWPGHRQWLGLGLAALAIVYAGGARVVEVRCAARREAGTLLAMGLAALAAAVPFVFEGRAIAPAWSAVGVALMVVGARGAPEPIAWGGAGMAALAAAEALLGGRWMHDGRPDPFLNASFACALAPAAALVAGGLVLRPGREGGMPGVLLVVGPWILAFTLGAEAWESVADLRGPGWTAGRIEAAAAAVAVAAAALAATAARRRAEDHLRALAALPLAGAFVLGMVWLAEGHGRPFEPVLNAGFGLCAFVVAAALAAGALVGGAAGSLCQIAALAFLLVLGTAEILAWGQLGPLDGRTRQEAVFGAQVVASVAWALYAAALLVLGFLRGRADLRWCGIVVFGLTAAKVFLFDMSQLDVIYRIGSFLVLGLLLVGASFLYQRRKAAG